MLSSNKGDDKKIIKKILETRSPQEIIEWIIDSCEHGDHLLIMKSPGMLAMQNDRTDEVILLIEKKNE